MWIAGEKQPTHEQQCAFILSDQIIELTIIFTEWTWTECIFLCVYTLCSSCLVMLTFPWIYHTPLLLLLWDHVSPPPLKEGKKLYTHAQQIKLINWCVFIVPIKIKRKAITIWNVDLIASIWVGSVCGISNLKYERTITYQFDLFLVFE